MAEWHVVRTGSELVEALQSGERAIEVEGVINALPMVTLPPGTRLRGGILEFGAKGVRLTRDNTLEDVTIWTSDHEVALLNDTAEADLGELTLRRVTVTGGQVLLVARDAVRGGHVQVDGLAVLSADLRGRVERPHGFGVDAMQGAFTLWNQQADPAATMTAELLNISAGTEETPIRGSGVFVGGHGNWDGLGDGGTVRVSTLQTGEIYTNGGIGVGTADLISGGVFVISGADVDNVVTAGPVTTYGQNDMVLDNWGTVRTWVAQAPVTSHGPSGIGFVNFGTIDSLDVRAPIQTFGTGSRGFNLYDGSLRRASFDSIATHGDGSIGVQVSRDLPTLRIRGDLSTGGSEGMSLVRGVQVPLKAIALSVKPAGRIGSVDVGGRMVTGGDDVVTADIEGTVDQLAVDGGVFAYGQHSDAIHLHGIGPDVSGVQVTAAHGRMVVQVAP